MFLAELRVQNNCSRDRKRKIFEERYSETNRRSLKSLLAPTTSEEKTFTVHTSLEKLEKGTLLKW
jgi:hypothetical protein